MTSRFLLLLSLLTLSTSLLAQEEEKPSYELGGFVELDQISYFNPQNEFQTWSRNQGILQLELSGRQTEALSFFTGIEIRNDLSDPNRNRVFVDEAYIDIEQGKFDLRAGKQLITWGRADAVNFTDNLNPIDFSDFLDTEDEKIGVWSTHLKYYPGRWTLESVVIPVFNASLLPQANSPWLALDPTVEVFPGTFLNATYQFNEAVQPPKDWRGAQYAFKAGSYIGSWDFSFSYYNGYNDVPRFLQQAAAISPDTVLISLTPGYHPWEVWGFDFSTTKAGFGLRGEAAYFLPQEISAVDFPVDEPFFQYAVGLDRNFANTVGSNNLFVIVQWMHEFRKGDVRYPADDLNHIFQESLLARMELELGYVGTLSMQGVYNFYGEDFYLQPEFKYQFGGGLNLSVRADILGGEQKGFFGQYRKNDRLQVRLKYNF